MRQPDCAEEIANQGTQKHTAKAWKGSARIFIRKAAADKGKEQIAYEISAGGTE